MRTTGKTIDDIRKVIAACSPDDPREQGIRHALEWVAGDMTHDAGQFIAFKIDWYRGPRSAGVVVPAGAGAARELRALAVEASVLADSLADPGLSAPGLARSFRARAAGILASLPDAAAESGD